MVEKLNKPEINTGEPLVFALDTSSKTTSMAVARGEKLLRFAVADHGDARSEKLWTDIESLLSGEGFSVRDIDLFSVCVGPGGFTGLRIGVAASKGLAQAAGKPIAAITSLEAAAVEGWPSPIVCAMVNAYKGEAYWQLFSFDGARPVAASEPQVSSVEKAIEELSGIEGLTIVCDATVALMDDRTAWSIKRYDGTLADKVAKLGLVKYLRGEVATPESLRACYVRRAEAEVKLELGVLGSKIERSRRQEQR
jgi:tRNA threonylcarbamoyladenosine biosynthesis protein TsaB